jgi:phage FluMu protein Com
MEALAVAVPSLGLLQSVRCLECSEVYAKPSVGGTVEQNPGCPACGYVGWIPVSLPREQRVRPRSGADLRRRPPLRAH